MSTDPGPDPFDRISTRIGDLDHPFYAEERHRDVWNEASAVGFQLLLWGLLIAAAVAVWVGGRQAHPYALVMTTLPGLAAVVVLAHALRRGVDALSAGQVVRPGRLALAVVVVGALAAGMLRNTGVDLATVGGMAVGAAVVLLLFGGGLWLARRRTPVGEDD